MGEGEAGQQQDNLLFGDKYLTSPTLMTLELKDASLRRHIILQFLISIHYLLQPRKAAAAAPAAAGGSSSSATAAAAAAAAASAAALLQVQQQAPSPATMQRDLAPLQAVCYALLRRCPPSGHRFARVIQRLLGRESHLHTWKLAGAQPFEKPLLAAGAESTGAGAGAAGTAGTAGAVQPPAKRPRTAMAGLMASRAVYPNVSPAGASAASLSAAGPVPATKRPLAWASAGMDCDLLAVCSNPARAVRPTLAAYLVPLRLAIDPSQGIEPEFSPVSDGLYVWRGLRLLAEEKLEAFFNIAVGKNSFTEAVVEAFEITLPPAPAPAPAPEPEPAVEAEAEAGAGAGKEGGEQAGAAAAAGPGEGEAAPAAEVAEGGGMEEEQSQAQAQEEEGAAESTAAPEAKAVPAEAAGVETEGMEASPAAAAAEEGGLEAGE